MTSRRSTEPVHPDAVVRALLRPTRVASLPELSLHLAHPGSRLSRLHDHTAAGTPQRSPYWAYVWPGGAALARHILNHPQTVAGRRVLDLGSGSGLVAIAAAKAGAAQVLAVDVDPLALAATALNAATNGVNVLAVPADPSGEPPQDIDLVLAGDVFYEPDLAAKMTTFLDCCLGQNIAVLIGDVGRAWLPHSRLDLLAHYPVADVGDGPDTPPRLAGVYRFTPAPAGTSDAGSDAISRR